MPLVELTDKEIDILSGVIGKTIKACQKPEPKYDWTPRDVCCHMMGTTPEFIGCAIRACKQTAELVCEAIVREVEEELKDSDWNLSYRQALEDTVDKIKCRENDDLRRLS